jgi:hypothetical protein
LKLKIIIVISIALSIIIIFLINQQLTKPENTSKKGSEYITKGDFDKNTESALPQNYTSQDLLDYCTKNESQSYNDICIRGMWQVGDLCKNGNFSSNNSICHDPKFEEFGTRVDKEMKDLDKSLTKVVDACMNANMDSEIQSCLLDIERIKNDCNEPHFYSLTSICTDLRLDQFTQKYKNAT